VKPFAPLLVAAGCLAAGSPVVNACSACMIADPKTAGTYLGMTLMLSALPLGLIGGLIYWLRRRYSRGMSSVSRAEGVAPRSSLIPTETIPL
jgi:hypothetical protein